MPQNSIKMDPLNRPCLYLIPCTLGDSAPLEVLPLRVRKTIEPLTHFIVENERAARRFIKRIAPQKPQDQLRLYPLNKFTDPLELQHYLDPMEQGHSMGLLSDAGCPGVADPGAIIVKRAHKKNYRVHPLVGPSSLLLALMASGMNGQQFAFKGYLPRDQQRRERIWKEMKEGLSRRKETQIFMEPPYRNDQAFKECLNNLPGDQQLCVAVDLTLKTEWIGSFAVSDWKRQSAPDLDKRPCLFLIGH